MALQATTVSISLSSGIDTKTDKKFVAYNKLLAADNARFFNVQSATKRYGQTIASNYISDTFTQLTTGKSLGTLNNELLVFNGTNFYGYASGQDRWFDRGTLTETVVDCQPIIRSNGSVNGIASFRNGLLELYAWEDTRAGVRYAVRDSQSGTFAVPDSTLNGVASMPQIVSSGNYAYIFYATPTQIRAAQFLQNDLARGIVQTFVLANVDARAYGYSVVPLGVNDPNPPFLDFIALTYCTSLDGTVWNSYIYYSDLVAYDLSNGNNLVVSSASTTVRPSGASNIGSDVVNVWIATSDNLSVTGVFGSASAAFGTLPQYTPGFPAGSTITALAAGAIVTDNAIGDTQLFIGATQPAGQDFTAITYPVNQAILDTLYGLNLASAPVSTAAQTYIVLVSSLTTIQDLPSQQPTFYLCGAGYDTDGSVLTSPLSILQRFQGSNAFIGGTALPRLNLDSDSNLFVGLAQRIALRADANGTVYAQSGLMATHFSFPEVSDVQITQFGSDALINCGNTYSYDGSSLIESGFWQFPEGVTASTAPAGSGLSAGLYTYCVTYEWTDSTGNVCLSAPSYPSPVNGNANFGITVAGGDQVTLTIPYTALTKKVGAQVCIYRTTVNQSGPYYKIASVSNDPGLTGVQSFQYGDGASDIQIESQQFLYAPPDGSGEIENDAPPPFLFMTATKTRVFGVAQDDRTALWYSKPLAPGRPAEWSAAQVIRIETAGGNVTALSYLDTQAVVFKSGRIYYLPGDGPNAAGQPYNAFPQTLQTISTTSGCINSKSVLAISAGLYFQSELGLENLNRSLTVDSTFGLPVQAYSKQAITGCAPAVSQNQLRWVSSDGPALIFDYIVGRWSTYSNYLSVGYTNWNGTTARLTAQGRVYYEDATTYLDAGQPVTMTLETSWIKLAAVTSSYSASQMAQGYTAIWYAEILGTYKSSHTLNIAVYYDYLDAAVQLGQFNATVNGNFGTWGSSATWGSDPVWGSNISQPYTERYQPRIALKRQVCEAIKFKIYDSSITGASCDLNEIALQLGVIGGLNRVPVSQQV